MTQRVWALKVLGLDEGASETEIREAYRDLVSVWHPDKHAHNERVRLRAERMVKRLNTARDILLGTGDGAAWTEDDEFDIDDETPPEEECPPDEPGNGEDYETEPAATEPEMRGRSELFGAAGMSVVAAAMLAWAVWGSPPYAFFGVMKWAVAATCAYWAVLLWLRSKALAPLCLLLLAVGLHYAIGEIPEVRESVISALLAGRDPEERNRAYQQREAWVPVHKGTGLALLTVATLALASGSARVRRGLLAGVLVAAGVGATLFAVDYWHETGRRAESIRRTEASAKDAVRYVGVDRVPQPTLPEPADLEEESKRDQQSYTKVGRVLLGKLGQAVKETKILSKPGGRAYYTLKPFDYIVLKTSDAPGYYKVLLENGKDGYVNSDDVARLPYDVTRPAAPGR